jgi:hypothetical protein
MSTDRLRARHLGWIAAALVAASLTAACSDDGGDAVSHTPLATTAPGGSDLLCDIVPRQSVATALGYEPGAVETNHGDTTTLTTDPNTGHVNGRCLIRSATRSEMALTVTVLWPSTEQQQAVQAKLTEGTDYTFPSDFAEGYADGSPSSAVAEVIWGDYVVTVVDNEPADGRDPLKDSVALVHQVIDAIDLAKTPADGASSSG